MKKIILNALKEHARGNIALHRANIEVYLNNPAGIGEHSDILKPSKESWIRLLYIKIGWRF